MTAPGLGVDLGGAQVRAVRVGEVLRVEGGVGVQRRLDTVGQVVRGEHGERDVGHAHALVGAPDGEAAALEVEVVGVGLQDVGRDDLGLVDHLLGRLDHRDAADDQRAGAVGVQAPGRDLGVPVQHLDVVERHAQLVGDDLAPRRLVALAVCARAGDDLDLAGGQHPDRRGLPAAGGVVQRAEHPGGRQAAHLGEGRDADAELHRVLARTPLGLLAAQPVVVEQLGRPWLVAAS